MGMTQASEGELLLDLRCLRNQLFGFGGEKAVNYCLIYDVFETGAIAAGTLIAGELLPGLPYLRNALQYILRAPIGELLLGLPYLRNNPHTPEKASAGELLLGLPYLRNT